MTGKGTARNADSGTPPQPAHFLFQTVMWLLTAPPPLHPTPLPAHAHMHPSIIQCHIALLIGCCHLFIDPFIHSFIFLSIHSFLPSALAALGLPEQQDGALTFFFFQYFFVSLSFTLHLYVPFHQLHHLILLTDNER